MSQPNRFSQFQETILKKPNLSSSSSSMKVKSLIKRQETVFKKARELSVLCGIEICVICYGPDGKLKIWPEDREKVEVMARRYSGLNNKQRLKRSVGLKDFLQKISNDDSKKKREVRRGSKVKYPVWDPKFDNYSVDQLAKLYRSLERSRTRIQHRLSAVVESQGQRKIQNTNMVNQELMMTTSMNNLQQHPNQVSMYMFNHGNGSLSQIPVSAPALNQAQSLAPIPRALTNYSISNVGNYSGLLGVQETGISGFQNMNMITYNGNNSVNDFSEQIVQHPRKRSYSGLLGLQQQNRINEFQNINTCSYHDLNNFNADDYLCLLGIQGTGTNVLGNMNMYDNNNNIINTNGSSHQLAQYPSQTPAPGFQFGSAPTNY